MQYYLHMVVRDLWLQRIEGAWARRNVIWLSGVRRAGKTCLCRSLDNIEYNDCELPSVRRMLADPELFLGERRNRRIVLDEIHRLANPSEVLKIAADHFPAVKVIATGSSTLGASSRFRDTLAGRRQHIWLSPILVRELDAFGGGGMDTRFLRGGLPEFYMDPETEPADYQDWLDAYWAKDILELFRLERRYSFLRFVELLFTQSGGIFEATRFAAPCEVSRTTIHNYLSVLEATFVIHVVRPYSTRRSTEIVAAPKVYAFDTGFAAHFLGLESLRDDDRGFFWEHLVLNELLGVLQLGAMLYWRDKNGHEVDFVYQGRGDRLFAIECKWSADAFTPRNLMAFHRRYPNSVKFVVTPRTTVPYERTWRDLRVRFVGLEDLINSLAGA